MENGTFASQEQMFHFSQYLKNLTFQRCPKALVWSEGLKKVVLSSRHVMEWFRLKMGYI